MTSSLAYVVESVPWALVGLLVGLLIGRSIVAVDAIADAAADVAADAAQREGDTMSTSDSETRQRRRRRRWFNANNVIVAVIVALGLVTAVQAYVDSVRTERQQTETRRLYDCLRDFSNGIADALDARSAATGAAQDALDRLIFAVPTSSSDTAGRAAARKAFDAYKDLRKKARTTQAAHPFPPAPRDVCRNAG